MRLYLDTNILVYMLLNSKSDIHNDVNAILTDYGNTLNTSTVCMTELIHLFQIGKISMGKKRKQPVMLDLVNEVKGLGIDIIPVTEKHLEAFEQLPCNEEHRDPNDRQIIAQAIADKAVLVSSDSKFSPYTVYGLDFVYNRR